MLSLFAIYSSNYKVFLWGGLTFLVGYFSGFVLTNRYRIQDSNIHLKYRLFATQKIKTTEREYERATSEMKWLSRELNRSKKRLGQLECEIGNLTESGAWCNGPLSSEHHTDFSLAKALIRLLQGKSVASFGEGPGKYKLALQNYTRRFDAYDGSPHIETISNNSVRFLDLSIPQYSLPIYDWVICLEVAEHIPESHQDILIGNILRHAKEGVIVSWAVPHQMGFAHINPKPRSWVKKRFTANTCFDFDSGLTRVLRFKAKLPWLKRNIAVFRKREGQNCDHVRDFY